MTNGNTSQQRTSETTANRRAGVLFFLASDLMVMFSSSQSSHVNRNEQYVYQLDTDEGDYDASDAID